MLISILYGLFVNLLNYAVFYITIKKLMKGRSGAAAGLIYFLSLLVRYAIIGILVYVFIKHRPGDSVGLIIGFTAGLLVFTIWRKNALSSGSDNI